MAGGAYVQWAAYVTERAVRRGVTDTPRVNVAGVRVAANPITIAAAVADLAP